MAAAGLALLGLGLLRGGVGLSPVLAYASGFVQEDAAAAAAARVRRRRWARLAGLGFLLTIAATFSARFLA